MPPPAAYLDGCTLAPDRFGSVSHKDICTAHDRDYWMKRRFTDKWAADFVWGLRLERRPFLRISTLQGYVATARF